MLVLSSVPVKAAMAQYSVMTNDSDVILHKVVLLEDEVDELAELSKENIEKVQQRGHRLEALQEKSEYLLAKTTEYRKQSNKLKKQKRWQSVRGCFCKLAVIVVPIIVAVIAVVVIVILVRDKQVS